MAKLKDETGPCFNCGDMTANWDYVGSRTVWICDAVECAREAALEDRGAREEAQYEAERDGYERYL